MKINECICITQRYFYTTGSAKERFVYPLYTALKSLQQFYCSLITKFSFQSNELENVIQEMILPLSNVWDKKLSISCIMFNENETPSVKQMTKICMYYPKDA